MRFSACTTNVFVPENREMTYIQNVTFSDFSIQFRYNVGRYRGTFFPGRAIPKALKMVPVATLLGAQHYKASTGFTSPNKYCTTNIATLRKNKSPKKSDNSQCLYSPGDRMEDWQLC